MSRRVWSLSGLAIVLAGTALAIGDGNLPAGKKAGATDKAGASDAAPGGRGGKNKGLIGPLTPEREAAALTFVNRHHADLGQLLKGLKEANPREYQRALRDLYKTSENLAQTQENDLRRYELDLRAWQLKSRIQLLAARLSMSHSQTLEDELRKALAEQVQIKIEQQELIRERTLTRLQEVETSLANLNKDREARVEQELTKILDGVGVGQKVRAAKLDDRPERSDKARKANPTGTVSATSSDANTTDAK